MLSVPRSTWVGILALAIVLGGIMWWLLAKNSRVVLSSGEDPYKENAGAIEKTQEKTSEQAAMKQKTFSSPLAGRWFAADPEELRAEIRNYFESAASMPQKDIIALVLPHAGYMYSGRTAAAGVKMASGKTYNRILVMGPSHRLPMENIASVPDYTHFETPLGQIALDADFIQKLKEDPHFRTVPGAFEYEHSVQIEVPLLQETFHDFRLVPVVVGQLDAATAKSMGDTLRKLVDTDTLVVVSSDFTHYGPNYGYLPFRENEAENLKKLDMGAFAFIEKKDAEGFLGYIHETGATICGASPIAVLLNLLPQEAAVSLVQYDTSGALMKDFTNSVSYLSIACAGSWPQQDSQPQGLSSSGSLTEEDKRRLLELARKTLNYALEHRKTPKPEDLGVEITPGMKQIMGAFVTLKKNGELRGCIGEIFPQRPVYEAVMAQTLNAAFEDPRFPPVRADELQDISFEISAYAEGPRPVASYEDIQLGRDGIVLEKQGRRALFLPQVAPEQGWDLPTTLEHLSRKAGLPPDAWKEGAKFSVFQAIVFGEEPES
ncbi:MAG TPA: AmmeMemoRadiSam system protein B [Candidatus Hydrogenedentes bacterium]|nr:AmmeMemoRadiSam system protein B [Candidatus Hydrogenedentota bacterium]HOL78325.1 AmmeMemoRadiSam system protein B [Candidatus Hydrogenedentota bacterium]HPO86315.1 AmmeMemoRadiSam system protein B [Candidatus Hydrogenedentota bacterium]